MNSRIVMVVLSLSLAVGCGSQQAKETTLSDGQSVTVLSSQSNGELQLARSAQPRLSNPDVVSFAQTMVNDFDADQAQLTMVASQQGLAAEATALSNAIDVQASAAQTELDGTDPALLDKTYLNLVAEDHTDTLALIDCEVLTSAKNDALRTYVSGTLRPQLATHLDAVNGLLATVPTGTPDGGVSSAALGLTSAPSDCSKICLQRSLGGLLSEQLRQAICH